jgi:hypothetical protein
MKPYRRLLTISAIFAVLIAAVVLSAQSSSEKQCTCNFDPAKMGRAQTLIEGRELSSAAPAPTSSDLMYPKTLTVCMFFDQTDKGYPTDLRLQFDGSVDGRNWFPLTLAGSRTRAEGASTCLQVAPVRYVRASWPAGSTIPSPGPKTTIQVQASY